MDPTGRSVHRDDAPISLKHLCTLLIKEINTDSLQNLPVNIYHEVTSRIETLRGTSKEFAAEEQIAKAQTELLFSAIRLLFEARYAKIVASQKADFRDRQKNELEIIDYSNMTRSSSVNEESEIASCARFSRSANEARAAGSRCTSPGHPSLDSRDGA